MLRRLKRSLAIMLSVASLLAYYTVPANAATLLMSDAQVTLSDTRPAIGSDYDFVMTSAVGTTMDTRGIRISFKTAPTDGAAPTGGVWDGESTQVELPADNNLGAGGWTIDKTAGGGVIYLESTFEVANAIVANTVIKFNINSITNPNISAFGGTACSAVSGDATNSAGTCYVIVDVFDTNTSEEMAVATPIQSVTMSYTLSNNVTVTAKVDPAFSFMIAGVNGGTLVNRTNAGSGTTSGELSAGVTTSARSEYNTLPFGNLQPGNKKYLAQNLTVNTNASNGYTVSMRMATVMTGIYGKTIDEFNEGAVSWSSPAVWTSPTANGTGSPADTGWLGAATTDLRVSGWAAENQNKWGPLGTGSNVVMSSAGPELSTTRQVSFIIDVNVFQPSDLYTGALQYNCVPVY